MSVSIPSKYAIFSLNINIFHPRTLMDIFHFDLGIHASLFVFMNTSFITRNFVTKDYLDEKC